MDKEKLKQKLAEHNDGAPELLQHLHTLAGSDTSQGLMMLESALLGWMVINGVHDLDIAEKIVDKIKTHVLSRLEEKVKELKELIGEPIGGVQ
jgi:hypothetical protein